MLRRGKQPPTPTPERPAAATDNANYLSAQVQQLLALVLPEPVVMILASISDLLYRLVLGSSNEPPTFMSTLVPPILLILVSYLSFLVVYRSIKSMVSLVIFSLKWTVIIGVIGVLVAYHIGNGDVRQGAQAAAQNAGGLSQQMSNVVQQNPGAQQYLSFLGYIPQQLAVASGALPALQGLSTYLWGQAAPADSRSTASGRSTSGATGEQVYIEMTNPPPRRGSPSGAFRGYRDVRPSRHDASSAQRTLNGAGRAHGRRDDGIDEREALSAGLGDVLDRISGFLGSQIGSGRPADEARRRSSRHSPAF